MVVDFDKRVRPAERTGRRRPGVALLVVIALVAVIAVLATIVTITISGDNDQQRIENAAGSLSLLAAAVDTARLTIYPAFRGQVGTYPGRLSHLYVKILATDLNCQRAAYGAATAAKWRGPYYLVPISAAGLEIAPGFTVLDSLYYFPTPSDLNFLMNNVSLTDAKALELFVDRNGLSDGTGPTVKYFPADGTTPVQVRYRSLANAPVGVGEQGC